MIMGEFRTAGSAVRDGDLVVIRIKPTSTDESGDTYHVPVSIMRGIVAECRKDVIRVRKTQMSLDGSVWYPAGSIGLSKTGKAISIHPYTGRHYVINAEAMREVLRGKIPSVTISEVMYQTGPVSNSPARA